MTDSQKLPFNSDRTHRYVGHRLTRKAYMGSSRSRVVVVFAVVFAVLVRVVLATQQLTIMGYGLDKRIIHIIRIISGTHFTYRK